ncbi:hypothetical protein DL546_007224 [Coniochaeta pulveracea]|uniref:Uncharacterized protein n=1 Tax=Coniochaeta pulveracea TaxID=177199 RepID=A0A420Y7P4_9PEZI|nr:hypothetical protein DL546_007224 [Coniochaeta pulveracea]
MVSLKEIVTTTTSGLAPGLETAPASPHVGVIALALEARQSGAKEPEENEMDEEDNTEEEANTEEENKQKNRSNDNDISRLFPTIPCSPITSEAGTNPEKQKKAPELYFHSSTRAARFLGERR